MGGRAAPVRGPEDVRERLRAVSRELEELGLTRIHLFGSVARGDPRPDSDVDLVVEYSGAMTFGRLARILDLLEGALGREVDVLTPGGLEVMRRPDVRERIRGEMVLVWEARGGPRAGGARGPPARPPPSSSCPRPRPRRPRRR